MYLSKCLSFCWSSVVGCVTRILLVPLSHSWCLVVCMSSIVACPQLFCMLCGCMLNPCSASLVTDKLGCVTSHTKKVTSCCLLTLVIRTHLHPYTGMFSSVAVLSCGPCPCSKLYMGVLGANHGGQTSVAAPLSIMISTLFSSCWTNWSVDAIGVDDILLSSAATRCLAGDCCSCAVVDGGAVSASCGVCIGSSLFVHCYTSWHHSPCLGNTTSCRLLFDSLWPSDLVGGICSILLLGSFLFLDCWLLCSFPVLCLLGSDLLSLQTQGLLNQNAMLAWPNAQLHSCCTRSGMLQHFPDVYIIMLTPD